MTTDEDRTIGAILGMYRQGWFPMADPDRGIIDWVQPDLRSIIELDPPGLKVSSTLAQRVRSGKFDIRCDTAFGSVIRACAEPREGRESSWIDARIIRSYEALARRGHAHSIEAWFAPSGGQPRLVGGLYGVVIGACFFGESMFSRPELGGTDSSKVCLVHLFGHLRRRGYALLDTQIWNTHIGSLGGIEIPREQFQTRLNAALEAQVSWGTFEAEQAVNVR
jgi:leucyl/phenylalanyl-tRNA--protein transferase